MAIYGTRKLHRIPLRPPRMVEIRNYKHYDAALFCEALNNILVDLEKNPYEEWLSFKDLFLTTADKHAPMI